jgi:hypothetical protein
MKKPEAMLVFVLESDGSATEAPFEGLDLPGVEQVRLLFRDSERIDELRRGFRAGAVREVTRQLLEELGPEGESFLREEARYQFVWDHAVFPPSGLVHVLHVVRLDRAVYVPPDDREVDVSDGRYLVGRDATTYDPLPSSFGDAGNWRQVSETGRRK